MLLSLGSVERKGKKRQKFEYLENEKGFLDEIKNIFHRFWRAIIWCKNKNLIKIADTNFKQVIHTYFGRKASHVNQHHWKLYNYVSNLTVRYGLFHGKVDIGPKKSLWNWSHIYIYYTLHPSVISFNKILSYQQINKPN